MITNRFMLCLIANVLFGLAGYSSSTWAATKDLGNTGWYVEFDSTKVKDVVFTRNPQAPAGDRAPNTQTIPSNAGTLTLMKEFANLRPIDIKFIERFPAGADNAGLRITLNETVKNMSGDDWKSFGLELIDPNPVLTLNRNGNNVLGESKHAVENHPGFAHFHQDAGQIFPPFRTVTPSTPGPGRGELQGNVIELKDGTFPTAGAAATQTWTGIGIHQIEEATQQRNFILRETPFTVTPPPPFSAVPPIPEPETYAMLLAGLGLMGVVVRRRSIKSAERVG